MEIRNAKISDFQEVFDLWKKAGLTVSNASRENREYELLLKKNPEFCLVGEENGVLVGSVLGTFNGRTAWIYHLAVNPEHQKKRLGTKLLEELEKRFRKEGVTRVRLGVYTPDLIPYYKRFGFSVVKDIIFMGKQLT